MTDILIANAMVITMDRSRRVIDHGAVAIAGGRVAEVGDSDDLKARHQAAQVIDSSDLVAMPGLIDCHGYTGHGLIKTTGGGVSDAWSQACETVYTVASSVDYWCAEAPLT